MRSSFWSLVLAGGRISPVRKLWSKVSRLMAPDCQMSLASKLRRRVLIASEVQFFSNGNCRLTNGRAIPYESSTTENKGSQGDAEMPGTNQRAEPSSNAFVQGVLDPLILSKRFQSTFLKMWEFLFGKPSHVGRFAEILARRTVALLTCPASSSPIAAAHCAHRADGFGNSVASAIARFDWPVSQ